MNLIQILSNPDTRAMLESIEELAGKPELSTLFQNQVQALKDETGYSYV